MSSFNIRNRCNKCVAIDLDDSIWAGREVQPFYGRNYVEFGFEHSGQRQYAYPSWRLRTDIRDSFPDLAVLSLSSQKGCDFCAFLKELLLSDEVRHLLNDQARSLSGENTLHFILNFQFDWRPARSPFYRQDFDEAGGICLKYFTISINFYDNDMSLPECLIFCNIEPLKGRKREQVLYADR
ncbi:hypothetical protein B0I35DRAFT_485351 [Stachybotrys elegans]|uniref:Uncharacterized protein n=1 Tax=Stachybotrys elegans TaxID=80388 RepID=A0A8K0SAK2_9HYPO|nr:hypothetical protein B0I35DRAFT_485351 [Stachybotrys elegans]